MAFTNEDIRALVETGQYSDSSDADYITSTLTQRRDKIGRTCLLKVLPLDNFAVSSSDLRFEDLAVKYGFAPVRQYEVSWSRFDNMTEKHTPLPADTSFRLPGEVENAGNGGYFSAKIHVRSDDHKTVTVYLRKKSGALEVVGIERTW